LLLLTTLGCRRELSNSARTATPLGSDAPAASAAAPDQKALLPESTQVGAVLVATAFVGPTCARQASGAVFCWSWSEETTPDFSIKWPLTQRVPLLEGAVGTTRSEGLRYFLKADGSVWVWGVARDQSRYGKAIFEDARVPKRVPLLPASHLLVSPYDQVYAFGNDGVVRSWSEQYTMNEDREYTGYRRSSPAPVVGFPDATHATEGMDACLISTAGKAFCVGARPPVWLPGSADAVQLVSCRRRVFARTGPGDVQAWDITSISSPSPEPKLLELPKLPRATSIACKDDTLYVVSSGDVFAWRVESPGGPVLRASRLTGVKELQLDLGPSCVLHEDGVVGCWGGADKRQIGGGQWPGLYAPDFTAFVEPLKIGVDISLIPMTPPPGPRHGTDKSRDQ
jgi:hypothetical protein